MQYYFGFQIIKNKVANTHNTVERYSVIQEGASQGAVLHVLHDLPHALHVLHDLQRAHAAPSLQLAPAHASPPHATPPAPAVLPAVKLLKYYAWERWAEQAVSRMSCQMCVYVCVWGGGCSRFDRA